MLESFSRNTLEACSCQETVDELLCSRREWHMSHTRTGRGYEGKASSLLEQLLQ